MRRRAPALLVALLLVLGGCGGGGGDLEAGARAADARPPIDGGAAFSLWLSAERAPLEPVELVAVLVSGGGGAEEVFGVDAAVDRWHDGDWWRTASS